jgi:hypothetical protein
MTKIEELIEEFENNVAEFKAFQTKTFELLGGILKELDRKLDGKSGRKHYHPCEICGRGAP